MLVDDGKSSVLNSFFLKLFPAFRTRFFSLLKKSSNNASNWAKYIYKLIATPARFLLNLVGV